MGIIGELLNEDLVRIVSNVIETDYMKVKVMVLEKKYQVILLLRKM